MNSCCFGVMDCLACFLTRLSNLAHCSIFPVADSPGSVAARWSSLLSLSCHLRTVALSSWSHSYILCAQYPDLYLFSWRRSNTSGCCYSNYVPSLPRSFISSSKNSILMVLWKRDCSKWSFWMICLVFDGCLAVASRNWYFVSVVNQKSYFLQILNLMTVIHWRIWIRAVHESVPALSISTLAAILLYFPPDSKVQSVVLSLCHAFRTF